MCSRCSGIVRRARQATGETCHIIMGHQGKMPYWEGQSYGVIPPGTNPKNGKPNSVRLYSIASSRYGDDMTGTTTSLCVRRATYWCPELKADDPAKKGVCSNYLCDSKPGEDVKLTGPTGKAMLMPEKDASTRDRNEFKSGLASPNVGNIGKHSGNCIAIRYFPEHL